MTSQPLQQLLEYIMYIYGVMIFVAHDFRKMT